MPPVRVAPGAYKKKPKPKPAPTSLADFRQRESKVKTPKPKRGFTEAITKGVSTPLVTTGKAVKATKKAKRREEKYGKQGKALKAITKAFKHSPAGNLVETLSDPKKTKKAIDRGVFWGDITPSTKPEKKIARQGERIKKILPPNLTPPKNRDLSELIYANRDKSNRQLVSGLKDLSKAGVPPKEPGHQAALPNEAELGYRHERTARLRVFKHFKAEELAQKARQAEKAGNEAQATLLRRQAAEQQEKADKLARRSREFRLRSKKAYGKQAERFALAKEGDIRALQEEGVQIEYKSGGRWKMLPAPDSQDLSPSEQASRERAIAESRIEINDPLRPGETKERYRRLRIYDPVSDSYFRLNDNTPVQSDAGLTFGEVAPWVLLPGGFKVIQLAGRGVKAGARLLAGSKAAQTLSKAVRAPKVAVGKANYGFKAGRAYGAAKATGEVAFRNRAVRLGHAAGRAAEKAAGTRVVHYGMKFGGPPIRTTYKVGKTPAAKTADALWRKRGPTGKFGSLVVGAALTDDPDEVTRFTLSAADDMADLADNTIKHIAAGDFDLGKTSKGAWNLIEGIGRMAQITWENPEVIKHTLRGFLELGGFIVTSPIVAAGAMASNTTKSGNPFEGLVETMKDFGKILVDDLDYRWRPVFEGDWKELERIMKEPGSGGLAWYIADLWPTAVATSRGFGAAFSKAEFMKRPRPELALAGGGGRFLKPSKRLVQKVKQNALDDWRMRRTNAWRHEGDIEEVLYPTVHDSQMLPLYATGYFGKGETRLAKGGRAVGEFVARSAIPRQMAVPYLAIDHVHRNHTFEELQRGWKHVSKQLNRHQKFLIALYSRRPVGANPKRMADVIRQEIVEIKRNRKRYEDTFGEGVGMAALFDEMGLALDQMQAVLKDLEAGKDLLNDKFFKAYSDWEALIDHVQRMDPSLTPARIERAALADTAATLQLLDNAHFRKVLPAKLRKAFDDNEAHKDYYTLALRDKKVRDMVKAEAKRLDLSDPLYFPSHIPEDLVPRFAKAEAAAPRKTGTIYRRRGVTTRLGVWDLHPEAGIRAAVKTINRAADYEMLGQVFGEMGYTLPTIYRLAKKRGYRGDAIPKSQKDIANMVRTAGLNPNDFVYVNHRSVAKGLQGRLKSARGSKGDPLDRAEQRSVLELLEASVLRADQKLPKTHQNVVLIPKQIWNEYHYVFESPNPKVRAWADMPKSVASRFLLGTSPSWLQFQVYANAVLAGVAVGGSKSWISGNRLFKNLDAEGQAAANMVTGVAPHYADYGYVQTRLMGWKQRVWDETYVGEQVLKGRPMSEILFRLDYKQNLFFRRIVLHNEARKEAIARMDANATGISKLMDKLYGKKGKKVTDDDIAAIIKDKDFQQELASRVNEFMGDYMGLSKFEKQVMNRSVMFYGFLRHSIQVALWNLPVKHPGRYAILSKLSEIANEYTRDVLDISKDEYIDQGIIGNFFIKGPVEIPFYGEVLGEGVHDIDLRRASIVGNFIFEARTGTQLLSAAPPHVSIPAELFLGHDFYTGRPFRVGPTAQYEQGLGGWVDPLPFGTSVETYLRMASDQVLRLLRPYGIASTQFTSEEGLFQPKALATTAAGLVAGKFVGRKAVGATLGALMGLDYKDMTPAQLRSWQRPDTSSLLWGAEQFNATKFQDDTRAKHEKAITERKREIQAIREQGFGDFALGVILGELAPLRPQPTDKVSQIKYFRKTRREYEKSIADRSPAPQTTKGFRRQLRTDSSGSGTAWWKDEPSTPVKEWWK